MYLSKKVSSIFLVGLFAVTLCGASSVRAAEKVVVLGGNNAGTVAFTDVWTSKDGLNFWNKLAPNTYASSYLPTRVFNWVPLYLRGKIYAIASVAPDALSAPVYSSSDYGVTWKRILDTAPWHGSNDFVTTTVFNGKLTVIGDKGVWSSTDGVSWNKDSDSPYGNENLFRGYKAIVFKDTLWVIGGHNFFNEKESGGVWFSKDGVTWTQIVTATALPWWNDGSASGRIGFTLGVFKDKIWVLGGDNNSIWSSTDGATWIEESKQAAFPKNRFGSALTYGGTFWFFIGGPATQAEGGKKLWSSTDGVHWVLVNKSAAWGIRQELTALVVPDFTPKADPTPTTPTIPTGVPVKPKVPVEPVVEVPVTKTPTLRDETLENFFDGKAPNNAAIAEPTPPVVTFVPPAKVSFKARVMQFLAKLKFW